MKTAPQPRRSDSVRSDSVRPGMMRRLFTSMSQSKEDQRAEELRVGTRTAGAIPIVECVPGTPTTISGVLRSVTLRPREGVPAVEAELYDGTGRMLVVWLGRRRIRGIEPGRMIVVTGRITCSAERPAIFNPKYELRAASGGAA